MKALLKLALVALLFLGSLELGSWLLLKSGFKNNRSSTTLQIHGWNNLDQYMKAYPEYQTRGMIYKNLHNRHPEIDRPAEIDVALRAETVKYDLRGEKTGMHLFNGRMMNSSVDDYYSLKGEVSGKTKYRVRYVTNEYGRRDPLTDVKKPFKANLIFMGCSFTWGEGTPQEKIFSSLIDSKLPQVRVYNTGIPGSGPTVLLDILSHERYRGMDGIDLSVPTTVVFTFIDDHMRRIVGTSEYISRSEYAYRGEPFYFLENDQLKHYPSFSSDFWSFRWALRQFGYSNLAKVTSLELPLIGDQHMKLTGKVFSEMKTQLQKRFPKLQDFIVATFPGSSIYTERVGQQLKREQIPFLDFSEVNIYSLFNGHHDLLTDPHPSSLMHELYADLLESELKNRF